MHLCHDQLRKVGEASLSHTISFLVFVYDCYPYILIVLNFPLVLSLIPNSVTYLVKDNLCDF